MHSRILTTQTRPISGFTNPTKPLVGPPGYVIGQATDVFIYQSVGIRSYRNHTSSLSAASKQGPNVEVVSHAYELPKTLLCNNHHGMHGIDYQCAHGRVCG